MNNNRNKAYSEQLKEQVTQSFDRIRKALDLREKLLLRQLSVVVQQSHHVMFQFDNIKFIDNGEDDLVGKIRTYGKYNIDNFNIMLKDPYENEDYIQPVEDHDIMHKSCRKGGAEEDHENRESEEIVVEFFNNKSLIKEGAEMVRESIINLALNESKELINQSFPTVSGLALEEKLERMKIDLTNFRNRVIVSSDLLQRDECKVADDNSNNNIHSNSDLGEIDLTKISRQHQMIAKASQTDLDKVGRHNGSLTVMLNSETGRGLISNSKHVDKNLKDISSLTMNNCGGTINLKNVTNLTINSCPDPPQDSRPTSEQGSPECGFYKRLITENKILRQHILKATLANVSTNAMSQHCSTTVSETSRGNNSQVQEQQSSDSTSDNTSDRTKRHRLPLTVTELRAILNLPQGDDTFTQLLGELFVLASPTAEGGNELQETPPTTQEHSKQIQQWLKQIISETETEPLQNAELLEFSRINTQPL